MPLNQKRLSTWLAGLLSADLLLISEEEEARRTTEGVAKETQRGHMAETTSGHPVENLMTVHKINAEAVVFRRRTMQNWSEIPSKRSSQPSKS